MLVLIGTNNDIKVKGCNDAFKNYFKDVEVHGINVSSDVMDEPYNDYIYKGALNRCNNLIKYARSNNINADYYVGVESGITNFLGKWCIIQITVIKDNNNYESFGTSSAFPVPDKYVSDIINTNLHQVMVKIFHDEDNLSGVSYLTKGKINRIDLTREAIMMALVSYINNNWK